MKTECILRLIDELAQSDVKRFSLFNNNEPLLDSRIQSLICYAREKLPYVQLTLSSNGKILTPDLIMKTLENGIDRLFISIPALQPKAYEKLMGGSLDTVLRTVLSVPEEKIPNLRIAVPKTKYYDPVQYEEVFGSRNIRWIVWEMEANSDWEELEDIKNIAFLNYTLGCDRPMDQAIISSNGDVLICCRDWHHENCVGNIYHESLGKIWNGRKMKEIQKIVAEERFEAISMCSKCSRVVNLDIQVD